MSFRRRDSYKGDAITWSDLHNYNIFITKNWD